MFSDVFCARLPRQFSPHAFSRIHGAIANRNLADGILAPGNLTGGAPG